MTTQTTWVVGVINITNTTYANSYGYLARDCHGCGDKHQQTGCMVNYIIPDNQSRHDWGYKLNQCGASVDYVSVSCLDYSVCPNIGGMQAQAQWANNKESASQPWYYNGAGLNNTASSSAINCIYPLSTFTSFDAVDKFRTNFPSQVDDPSSDYNTKVLPFFCMSQSSNCPVSSITGLPMMSCSRMVANGDEGAICRAWSGYSNTGSPLCGNQTTTTDALLYEYCNVFNDETCACINRDSNPVYQVMTIGQPSAVTYPTCFWQPCVDKTKYLVPTDLLCCPPNQDTVICNNINVVIGGESKNLSFNPNQYSTCGVNPDDNGGGGNIPSNIKEGGVWWWVLVAIIVLIAIVAIILTLVL